MMSLPLSRHMRASRAERSRSRTVDRLVPGANYRQVLAIDIDATPEAIWPWLMQLGYQRGGLYSYEAPGTWRSRALLAALRPAAFIMTHRMLGGIRRRAEAMARPDTGAPLHHAA